MAGRRTNLALLWATGLALATGVGSFLVGTPAGSWVIVAHGLVALAILVLAPWKSLIARRGLARKRPGRGLSIGLSGVTTGALVTGFLLVTGAADVIGPFTTMQLHVSFGLATVSLTLIHTLQRPVSHRGTDFTRRNALRAGTVLAGAGTLWLLMEAALDGLGARGGERRFTGSHEIIDPSSIPATQWLNDTIPHIPASTHEVVVSGRRLPVSILADGGDTVVATLDCTGGWYTTQEWLGTRLDRLLVDPVGSSVVIRSVTGYWRRFPVEQTSSLYLVTHLAGQPLPDGSGGPVRLVAAGRRGYWWVKWVDSVEVDDTPPWWQPPLPTA